jgi:hypothetical protein
MRSPKCSTSLPGGKGAYAPAHGAHRAVGERRDDVRDPRAIDDAVGIRERDHLAACGTQPGVARRRRTALRLVHRADPVTVAPQHVGGAVARSVVRDDDLEAIRGIVRREDGVETRADDAGAVAHRDDHGDVGLPAVHNVTS